MGMLVTVNWPANLLALGSFAPTSHGAARGLASLTPNANAQSTIDTGDGWPLATLLGAGFTIAPPVNTTANRPVTGLYPGQFYFDSTLGIPIWRNAANTVWVNSAGATV